MKKRVYIEIGNICNLSCSFCPKLSRAPRQMQPHELRHVLNECAPMASEIYFHLMGEPLLHPKLDELLSIAEEFCIPVCLTTNGTLLPRTKEILLSHCNIIKKVSISLQSYESNQRSASLSDYLQDCIGFAKEATAKGIYAVFRLWNLSRADRMAQNECNSEILERLHENYPESWQERYSGYRIAKNTFLERTEIFDWPIESTAEPTHVGHCHGMIDQIAILTDGSVVPCCLDAEGEITLGNLFESSLKEILSSPRARRMLEGLERGELVEPLCQRCTYARRFS